MKYYVFWYTDEKQYFTFATYAKNKTEAKRNFIAEIGSGYRITEIEERMMHDGN